MTLETVQQEIETEAQRQATALLKTAAADAKNILAKAKEEVTQYEREALEHEKSLEETTARKLIAAARFEAQRVIQQKRNELVAEVLQSVRQKLLNLPVDKKKQFLHALVTQAKQELADVAVIYANSNDLKLINFKTVKEAKIEGGIIAESSDGTISIDLSIQELLLNLKNKEIVQISGELFHE